MHTLINDPPTHTHTTVALRRAGLIDNDLSRPKRARGGDGTGGDGEDGDDGEAEDEPESEDDDDGEYGLRFEAVEDGADDDGEDGDDDGPTF
jgi:hypothetical protein